MSVETLESPRLRRTSMEHRTAYLLRQALESLERESGRRAAERRLRNYRVGCDDAWWRDQVAHIREWIART